MTANDDKELSQYFKLDWELNHDVFKIRPNDVVRRLFEI
jgi:hypothetical protein